MENKVCNNQHPYSEEWDTLLNLILDRYVLAEVRTYSIIFKVVVKKRSFWFDSHEYIEVWTANKDYSYGHIHNPLIRERYCSAKQETLNRLYKKEIELKTQPRKDLSGLIKKLEDS
jgi:hypothetical protein